MTPDELKGRISTSEFSFFASRSSGPGGQNVNKVNTRVELNFDFKHCVNLSDSEKELISEKLRSRINSNGELIVRSQSERSQFRNRKKAIERIFILLSGALTEKPERKPTAPTKKSRVERLAEKRRRGQIKNLRKDDNLSGEDF